MFKFIFILIGIFSIWVSMWLGDQALTSLGIKDVFSAHQYAVYFWAGGIALTGALSTWYLANDMAVWSVGAEYCASDDAVVAKISPMITELSAAAGLKVPPRLAVYPVTEINAIVVARSRSSSTVAVSQGLLERANEAQIRSVIGYAVSKISSGEIVPLLLLQGVVMAFTLFPARMFALLLGTSLRTADEDTPSDRVERLITAALEVLLLPSTALLIRLYSRMTQKKADQRAAILVGLENHAQVLASLESEVAPRVFRESYALPHKFGMAKLPHIKWLSFHLSYAVRANHLRRV